MTTTTITETATDESGAVELHQVTMPGDGPEDAAHMVMVPDGEPDETPQAYCLRATVEGFPVTALCGYTWVPAKDPRNKPVCHRCLEIYQQPGDHRAERDQLPEA